MKPAQSTVLHTPRSKLTNVILNTQTLAKQRQQLIGGKKPLVVPRKLADSCSRDPNSSRLRNRRENLCLGVSLVMFTKPVLGNAAGAQARELDTKMVGAYLPKSTSDEGFYTFVASENRTPALRAGALEQYMFSLPPEWKELSVSNAKSGNYCQPRCDEATTEVSFGSNSQGILQIVIIPTTKLLIAKKNPALYEVGSAKGILSAISPAITGSVAVEEEEIIEVKRVVKAGKEYYEYELFTPYAQSGSHHLTTVCTSMNYLVMAILSASDKQWAESEQVLRTVLESFSVGSSSAST